MQIVAFSDSHGKIWDAREVVERNLHIQTFIFLGDGADDIETLRDLYPHKEFYAVSGNCDGFCRNPSEIVLDFEGVKVFCAHGHQYSIKSEDRRILERAKAAGASVVLHGHTHIAREDYKDGIWLICPGSLYHPRRCVKTYALLSITQQGVTNRLLNI